MKAITCATLFACFFAFKASCIQAAVAYELLELSTCGDGRGFTAHLLLTNTSKPSAEDLHALFVSVRSGFLMAMVQTSENVMTSGTSPIP